MQLKDPRSLTREELEYRYAERQKEIADANLERCESVARAYRSTDQGQGEALCQARRMATEANLYADRAWREYYRQLSSRAAMRVTEA